jgi:hypothetical protein
MSTILKALRKLEDERPAPIPSDTTQLDRDVLETEPSERPRPLRRIALVMIAVLFAGSAGAGLTLAALTLWQTRSLNERNQGEPAAVAAPAPTTVTATVPVPVSPEEAAEEPTVVVVADILRQRSAARASATPTSMSGTAPGTLPETTLSESSTTLAPDHYAEPAPEIATVKPRSNVNPKVVPKTMPKTMPKTIARETTERLPEPLALARTAPARNPASELAAAREARMSRAPAEVRSATPRPVEIAVARSEPEVAETERAEWPELESVDVAPEPTPVSVKRPDPVPSLAVTRTTWHPMQHRRRAELSVIENGETRTIELKEGQFIGPFKVAEIGPTGVTLLRSGVETRRQVGAPHE